ncbi:hypothetical protein, partial [Escherichia coli]
MSSLNIKQGSDAHFPDYPLASPSNNEIDGNDSNLLIVFYVQIMPDDF